MDAGSQAIRLVGYAEHNPLGAALGTKENLRSNKTCLRLDEAAWKDRISNRLLKRFSEKKSPFPSHPLSAAGNYTFGHLSLPKIQLCVVSGNW